MKLTVRAEVMGGAILQQVFIVEYTVANQMCNDCHRSEAQDYWRALVSSLSFKCDARESSLLIHNFHSGSSTSESRK